MTINEFFNKSIGRWDSSRIYYKEGSPKVEFKKMKFEVLRQGTKTWEIHMGKNIHGFEVEKPGLMTSSVKRINSVSGIDNVESTAHCPTSLQLVLSSIDEDKGLSFTESIVFLEDDLRLRTSTVYRTEGGVFLLGSYIERRI